MSTTLRDGSLIIICLGLVFQSNNSPSPFAIITIPTLVPPEPRPVPQRGSLSHACPAPLSREHPPAPTHPHHHHHHHHFQPFSIAHLSGSSTRQYEMEREREEGDTTTSFLSLQEFWMEDVGEQVKRSRSKVEPWLVGDPCAWAL